MQVVNFLKYVNNKFSCLPSWWGLLCGGAYCARARCAHWVIRPFKEVYTVKDQSTSS